MAGTFFTGATNGRPVVSAAVPGSTRFNTTSNTYEVFDGAGWQTMRSESRNETMQEMVQHLEDRIAVTIEEEYKDNAAIQDAFRAWEEANERFKVVLAIAEKK